MNKNIARVVVGLPVKKTFDYEIPRSLSHKVKTGKRVKVPFARRILTGYVVGFANKPEVSNLKKIQGVLDREPLYDTRLLRFTSALARYYFCSWGEVLTAALPSYHRKVAKRGEVNLRRRVDGSVGLSR